MAKENKKFYITSSIAYTNAAPHIGFALEVLQADVLARHHRLKGEDVFFLTGTDEHGSKIFRKAKEAGKDPQEFVDEIAEKFRALRNVLNLSNDDFIRTSDQKRHWPTVRKIWQKLKDNGDIYKKKYQGLYCVGCEAFLKEKDLVDGKCPNHQKEPETIEEENYFFKLSKYQDKLKDILENNNIKVVPEARKNEMLSFVSEGLEDVSCSREKSKLGWGVPVADDEKQVVYVWFEALINYLSALDYAGNGERFKKYWPADVHCIGKDITRFHLLLWPAMLLSLGLPLPKTVFVHGYITSGGKKMSKSLGNVVDPFELVKRYGSARASTELSRMPSPQVGTDAVRYFLLREISPTEDGDFTQQKFEERYNGDLANGIGNLLSRALTLAEKKWDGVVPQIDINKTGRALLFPNKPKNVGNYDFRRGLFTIDQGCYDFFKNFEFNRILSYFNLIVQRCDTYIEDYKLYKLNDLFGKQGENLYDILEGIRHFAVRVIPFLPQTADKIFEQLGLDPEKEKKKPLEEAKKWGGLKQGTKIKKGAPLFPRLE